MLENMRNDESSAEGQGYQKDNDERDKNSDDQKFDKTFNSLDVINYQIREPISSIFAALPSLSNSINNCDVEKANKSLDLVYKKIYLILKNINNMSLATKISENQELTKVVADLSSLVESAICSSKIILPEYVTIDADIQKNILIKGNVALLSHAIFNLILNSIEYRVEDKVVINVSLTASKSGCTMTYSDNSLGIKPNIMPNIFDPYYTCNPYDDGEVSTKLGLGLYIAKAAFENSDGKILASSEFSSGVHYAVTFPACTQVDEGMVRSKTSDFFMNKYSEIFVQLCEYGTLPDLK